MQRDSRRIYDEYLVASARTGDRLAWERLVARWQPRLLRHGWRLTGDAEQARLDDVAAFPAWALQIVTRRCQRLARRAVRERAGMTAIAAEAVDAIADDTAARDADVARVLVAMRTLPPAQHAALALFHLEHLGVAEIAVALDIPPGHRQDPAHARAAQAARDTRRRPRWTRAMS